MSDPNYETITVEAPKKIVIEALRSNQALTVSRVDDLESGQVDNQAKFAELQGQIDALRRLLPSPVVVKRGRVYVPLFMWPFQTINGARVFSPHWQAVIDAKKAFPDVIIYACINENNGDYSGGRSLWIEAQFLSLNPNPDIIRGVAALEAAGIQIGVYVYTEYGLRSAEVVKQRIRFAKARFPKAKFIFFDEQNGRPEFVEFYKDLTAYSKAQGFEFTIGNPGTGVPQNSIGACDVTMIYESAGLFSNELLEGRTFGMAKEKFGCFPYGVTTYDTTWIKQCLTKVGLIYVTDDATDASISPDRDTNPWNATSKHLLALCADVLASGTTN